MASNSEDTADLQPTLEEAAVKAKTLLTRALAGLKITWISYLGLIGLFALNNLLASDGSLRFFLVQTVPLIIFVPGMIKRHYKTFSWLCFATLLYFTAYVVEVGAPNSTLSDAIALALSVILFIAAMMTSRWLQHGNYFQWIATRNDH